MGTSGGYPVYEDSATFYTAVSEFVQDGENAWFQSDVVFKDDGTIEASHKIVTGARRGREEVLSSNVGGAGIST